MVFFNLHCIHQKGWKTLETPQKFHICPLHLAFELLPQVTLYINVEYILYRSVGIYIQIILLSNLAVECLITDSIFQAYNFPVL